jgi:hypothetical protein
LEEQAAARAAAERRRRPASRQRPRAPAPLDLRSPFGPAAPPGAEIAVGNAGLVLAAPYFPALFQRLGLVKSDADGRTAWVAPEAAGRGVHVLQYLVDGRADAPEPQLALNKLICGLDPGWPALAGIEMGDEERATCDSLLQAILANWPMMKDSSIEALRETFLQREGRLERVEPGWKLIVERKTLDVLMDSLPWSFSMLLHPWMPEPLSVSW